MYQVAVLPPPEALGELDQLRRLHDPWFHRMPAHVALLPPFEPVRRDILARFDGLRAAAFTMRLGAPRAEGTTLWLDVVEGAAPITAIRDALHEALLDPAAPRLDTPPAVRIGHFATTPELELARRSVASSIDPAAFDVTHVSLLLEDVRGLWHAVRERALRG